MGKRGKKLKFDSVIKNRQLPILTLDSRWHELFPEDEKTPSIKEYERHVNNLLKEQGKLIHDIKDMKALKKTLMTDIVANMDDGNNLLGKSKGKKLDKNKQYINEINTKLDKTSDQLAELPYQIKEANEMLMMESMKLCYERLSSNHKEIAEISSWIAQIREDLKLKILAKQDMETMNNLIYTYMHSLLGADLIERLDEEFDNTPKPE